MPRIYPFRPIEYASSLGRDLSAFIAPPYDVLDAAGKARLLAKDPRNMVAVDLPHTPAKELGPASAYSNAAERLRAMLSDGTLVRSQAGMLVVCRQSWNQPDPSDPSRSVRLERSGVACCVDTVPLGARAGGGILPHEETFSGPKQDRLALMRATGMQLSPIFGLHADASGAARNLLAGITRSRSPDRLATTDDGTLHELWHVSDPRIIADYQAALAGEDVFIADGHHRYTTGLNYLSELERSGHVSADHPARRTMMVLIGMTDPGLVIWPTHRVLGGMAGYSLERFVSESNGVLVIDQVPGDLAAVERALHALPIDNGLALGLWDFATRKGFIATPVHPDPMGNRYSSKPPAWRKLDVALCQHVIVEEICQGRLNAGQSVKWAFPHTIREVEEIGSGRETGAGGGSVFGPAGAQLGVIVRPTPLDAVREVSRVGELMPQKSTFFYPKLATGLFMHG